MPDQIPPPPAGYTVSAGSPPPPPPGYAVDSKKPVPPPPNGFKLSSKPKDTSPALLPPGPPVKPGSVPTSSKSFWPADVPVDTTHDSRGFTEAFLQEGGKALWGMAVGAATTAAKALLTGMGEGQQFQAEDALSNAQTVQHVLDFGVGLQQFNHTMLAGGHTLAQIKQIVAAWDKDPNNLPAQALKKLEAAWQYSPGSVLGKAAANVLVAFLPYGKILGAGGAEAVGAAKAASEGEGELITNPLDIRGRKAKTVTEAVDQAQAERPGSVLRIYTASDEFASGITKATGRGQTTESVPSAYWHPTPQDLKYTKPSFGFMNPFDKPAPSAATSAVSDSLKVKPNYDFMNPLKNKPVEVTPSTTVMTESGSGVLVKGDTAKLFQSGGFVYSEPITLEDGTVIETPAFSPEHGFFDMSKGTQAVADVHDQIWDIISGKPINNLRVFHPDPETQGVLQQAVDNIQGISSARYLIKAAQHDGLTFGWNANKALTAIGGIAGPKGAAWASKRIATADELAAQRAVYEGLAKAGSEKRTAMLDGQAIQNVFEKKFKAMGTSGDEVYQQIVSHGAEEDVTSPATAGAKHARAGFDVWFGAMRSLGMKLGYKMDYMPILFKDGHIVVDRALEKLRIEGGHKYVPDLLKQAGLKDEQIASVMAKPTTDPRRTVADAIAEHLKIPEEQQGTMVERLQNALEASVQAEIFSGVKEYARTQGVVAGGMHGITMNLSHVMHQGLNHELIDKLGLHPITNVSELMARQYMNIARNVRDARMLNTLKKTGEVYTAGGPGLKPFSVGTDVVYFRPRVHELVSRIIPPEDRHYLALSSIRVLSRISKEGAVGWNPAIHAKTITEAAMSLVGPMRLSEALSGMSQAARDYKMLGPITREAVANGLPLSFMKEHYGSIFTEITKWIDENMEGPLANIKWAGPKELGWFHDKMHEGLFEIYIPTVAIRAYQVVKQNYISGGMSESAAGRTAASQVANRMGMIPEIDIPSKLREGGYLWMFAPMYKLGSFRAMGEMFGAFLPAAATPAERTMQVATAWKMNAYAAAYQFILTNMVQYAITQHATGTGTYATQNDKGRELDIWTGTYGQTASGKTEKVYVRFKSFTTDYQLAVAAIAQSYDQSLIDKKPMNLSPVVQELYRVSGPVTRYGIDIADEARQHKLTTQYLKTQSLESISPSWLQEIGKEQGWFAKQPYEVSIPAQDLWWALVGLSPYGAAPPKTPGLNLKGPSLKGLKGP